MIFLTNSLLLSPGAPSVADHPRIGWHNLVTEANVTSTQANANYPIQNLANPLTGGNQYWRGGASATQTVTMSLGSAHDINYIAIGKHNLGSITATIAPQYWTGSAWAALGSPVELNTNFAFIYEFEDVLTTGIRFILTNCSAPPEIAVWYVGEILRMPNPMYVGYTPFIYGEETTVSSAYSESGQFMGRIERSNKFENTITLPNLRPDWVRTYINPMKEAIKTRPFFWAWAPESYPDEVGFVWTKDDIHPRVDNDLSMSFTLNVQGIR